MPDYATPLRDHVTLKIRSIDRMLLQGYVSKLRSVGVQRFAEGHRVPLVHFEKGESKEERVRPLLQRAAEDGGDGRVVLIGMAQEKASAWRSWKAKGQEKAAHPHMEWGRQMTNVNHFNFYLWDPEWGPAFWKTNAYGPPDSVTREWSPSWRCWWVSAT